MYGGNLKIQEGFEVALQEMQSQSADLYIVIFKNDIKIVSKKIFAKRGTIIFCPSQKLVDKFLRNFLFRGNFLVIPSFLVDFSGYFVYPKGDKRLIEKVSTQRIKIKISLIGHI